MLAICVHAHRILHESGDHPQKDRRLFMNEHMAGMWYRHKAGIWDQLLEFLGILDGISVHPFLKERLVLKGGTALNLFFFDLPRLYPNNLKNRFLTALALPHIFRLLLLVCL